MTLDLSNFSVQPSGSVIHMQVRLTSALRQRTGNNSQFDFWSGAGWTNDVQVGTIEEGSWTVTGISGVTPQINRIFKVINVGDMRLGINTSAGGMEAMWDQSTDPYSITIVREKPDDTVDIVSKQEAFSHSGGFIGWSTQTQAGDPITAGEWAIINAIASGDSLIVAFHTGTPVYTVATPPSGGPMNIKYNGVNISAAKYNGVDITAAKYNGVEIYS